MEALYAFHSGDEKDEQAQFAELTSVFDHILHLYYYQLAFLVQMRLEVSRSLDKAKKKYIPSEEDLNPNMRLANNTILIALQHDNKLNALIKKKGITWKDSEDLIPKTVRSIKQSHEYAQYLQVNEPSFEDDRKFLKRIFKRQIMENELLDNFYSEGNLYWEANMDIANRLVLDTIDDYKQRSTSVSSTKSHVITKLLNKEEEQFVQKLFEGTIKHDADFQLWIAEKAKNWEEDRIAVMDMLLMKMAICEILEFPVIPVKVSMNEYIEISKRYSAQESKGFINGVLDKIIADLRKEDKIKKKGKGLIES
ncbi:MAG: transcription antitermination factor NusB [Flavobacteriales bacterium]|nr:transcription antitermination factor NusB [Flavobacteriales bacterium]